MFKNEQFKINQKIPIGVMILLFPIADYQAQVIYELNIHSCKVKLSSSWIGCYLSTLLAS